MTLRTRPLTWLSPAIFVVFCTACAVGPDYHAPADFRRDLLTIAGGLSSSGKGQFAGIGALGRLIRAVEVFGFHLATLDMRQNSAVHERVLAELLSVSGVCADYLALGEEIGRAHV